MCIYMYICIYVCMYVCIYVCMYVCIIEYFSKGVVSPDLGIWRLGHNFKLQYLWF